jgi:hypothetical protein
LQPHSPARLSPSVIAGNHLTVKGIEASLKR